jgi:hypothetical protein
MRRPRDAAWRLERPLAARWRVDLCCVHCRINARHKCASRSQADRAILSNRRTHAPQSTLIYSVYSTYIGAQKLTASQRAQMPESRKSRYQSRYHT